MSELYALAELISKELEDETQIESLKRGILFLHSSRRDCNVDEFVELMSPELEPMLSKNIFFELENQGILTNTLDKKKLDSVFATAKMIWGKEDQAENYPVATLPDTESEIDDVDFKNLQLELKDLIRSTQDQLFILNPFFSSHIVDQLKAPIRHLAKRNVDIKIVTRYLTYNEEKPYNRRFIRNLFEEDIIRERSDLFEYVDKTHQDQPTFHAKMVLSDNKQAYLGTANLTHKGLQDNLELGVVFRDETVGKLFKLANAISRSELIHPVVLEGDNFARK